MGPRLPGCCRFEFMTDARDEGPFLLLSFMTFQIARYPLGPLGNHTHYL